MTMTQLLFLLHIPFQYYLCIYLDFPGGSVIKNPPANAGDVGLIPGLGRFAWRRNGNPLQYSCLGNCMERGAWWATVHGVAKQADMSQHLNNSYSIHTYAIQFVHFWFYLASYKFPIQYILLFFPFQQLYINNIPWYSHTISVFLFNWEIIAL